MVLFVFLYTCFGDTVSLHPSQVPFLLSLFKSSGLWSTPLTIPQSCHLAETPYDDHHTTLISSFSFDRVYSCNSSGFVSSLMLHATASEIASRRVFVGNDPDGSYTLDWDPFNAAQLSALDVFGMRSVYTGGVMPSIEKFPRLTTFLFDNHSLTGSLPTAYPSDLTLMIVRQNRLTGTVPAAFVQHALTRESVALDASVNRLTGTLPLIPAGSKSSSITLYRNQLTGPVTAGGAGEAVVLLVDDGGCADQANGGVDGFVSPEDALYFGCPVGTFESNCFDCFIQSEAQRAAVNLMSDFDGWDFGSYCKARGESGACDSANPVPPENDDAPSEPQADPPGVPGVPPALPTTPAPLSSPGQVEEDSIIGLSIPAFSALVAGVVVILVACCALIIFCVCGATVASRRRSQRVASSPVGRPKVVAGLNASHPPPHGKDAAVRRSRRNSRARSTNALRRQTVDTAGAVTTASHQPYVLHTSTAATLLPAPSSAAAALEAPGMYTQVPARYEEASTPLQ
uniref:Uncharacterized protein n=1 Tax=Sexangularia sp. CB-2014 TaxID=1486929 RepID=A0A7S1VNL0_9EUKA